MPSDAITGRLAAVFERAPGLVAALRNADEDTPRAIIAKARGALDRMTEDERIAVLSAHPRIGADPASLSMHSTREDGAAARPRGWAPPPRPSRCTPVASRATRPTAPRCRCSTS